MKPEEKAPIEEKKEEKPEVPAEPPAAQPSPKKKINQMTLEEIEAKLKDVQEQMGGLESKYAQQLLLRKKLLTST